MGLEMKRLLNTLSFFALTVTTQIGGVVFILSHWLAKKHAARSGRPVRLLLALYFVAFYLFSTFFLVPRLAAFWGRVPVSHSPQLTPNTYLTVLLNRNYVVTEVNAVLEETLQQLPPTAKICYLDANFPFINRFPLLPHLSHNDGKKLDLAFAYLDEDGQVAASSPSRSGYGVFEGPQPSEFDQTAACKQAGYWQYDYSRFLTLGTRSQTLQFAPRHTRALVAALLDQPEVEKVFLEPHLCRRLGLDHPKLRFHGCGAVRHDDHIHLQVK